MKFTSLLKSLILEQSRFEVLLNTLTKAGEDKEGNKTKPKLTKKEFFDLVKADPTTRLNDVNLETAKPDELAKVKAGSYVAWLIKNYLNPTTETAPGDYNYEREAVEMKRRFIEDLYYVTEDLKKFEKHKGKLPVEKRDINKLNKEQLYDAVKDFDITVSDLKDVRRSIPIHPGAKLAFEGPTWRVIEIDDKGSQGKTAACFYGGHGTETTWCTSRKDQYHFDSYIKQGPLYVIYKPSDENVAPETGLPVERYQIHFPSNQFTNKQNQQQDLIKYLTGPMAELKDFFKPEFAKGLTIGNGEKLVIDDFQRGATGKFIALYGLDELIDSLPSTLKEFQIQNRDQRDGFIIAIPPSISRFKNLEAIMLENCIDSIPDTICQLKELQFISLVKNPKLTSIPECIANMQSLLFLNLKDSKNVQVPEAIKEKGKEWEDGMWDLS